MRDPIESYRAKCIRQVLLTVVIAITLVLVLNVISSWVAPHDDTDPPGGRSGMELLTDSRTGCQYLYRRGAITPRMDGNGKQICEAVP